MGLFRHVIWACRKCCKITNCLYIWKGLGYCIGFLPVVRHSTTIYKLQFDHVIFEISINIYWAISILKKKMFHHCVHMSSENNIETDLLMIWYWSHYDGLIISETSASFVNTKSKVFSLLLLLTICSKLQLFVSSIGNFINATFSGVLPGFTFCKTPSWLPSPRH